MVSLCLQAAKLRSAGVASWQIEMIGHGVPSSRTTLLAPALGVDLPAVPVRPRADQAGAFAAAQPEARESALQLLKEDFLARSTVGPVQSRLLLWSQLCAAWDLRPYPLLHESISAVAVEPRARPYLLSGSSEQESAFFRAESVVLDSSAFGLISRPRFWTRLDWGCFKTNPSTNEPSKWARHHGAWKLLPEVPKQGQVPGHKHAWHDFPPQCR